MDDDAGLFWEHVKQEIKKQNTTQEWVANKAGISFNTFQGWIAKGIFPRVNEAVRIASALKTPVELFTSGTVRNSEEAIGVISREVSEIYIHLEAITQAIQNL